MRPRPLPAARISGTLVGAWMACGVVLVALALAVHGRELLPGELWVARGAQRLDGTPFGSVAHWLDIGLNDARATAVFVVAMLAVALAWGPRAAWLFGWAGLATVTAKVADIVPRPRPTDDLSWGTYLPGYGGFPSGHVVYITVLAMTLVRLSQRYGAGKSAHGVLAVGATVVVLAIGPARAITNDHWFADIVAGYLLAAWYLLGGRLAVPVLDGAYGCLSRLVAASPAAARLRRVGERRQRQALPG